MDLNLYNIYHYENLKYNESVKSDTILEKINLASLINQNICLYRKIVLHNLYDETFDHYLFIFLLIFYICEYC